MNSRGAKYTALLVELPPYHCQPIIYRQPENIVCSQIGQYLDYNILNPNQHGFRKGLSCEAQLVSTIHELAYCINRKNRTFFWTTVTLLIKCLVQNFSTKSGTTESRQRQMPGWVGFSVLTVNKSFRLHFLLHTPVIIKQL